MTVVLATPTPPNNATMHLLASREGRLWRALPKLTISIIFVKPDGDGDTTIPASSAYSIPHIVLISFRYASSVTPSPSPFPLPPPLLRYGLVKLYKVGDNSRVCTTVSPLRTTPSTRHRPYKHSSVYRHRGNGCHLGGYTAPRKHGQQKVTIDGVVSFQKVDKALLEGETSQPLKTSAVFERRTQCRTSLGGVCFPLHNTHPTVGRHFYGRPCLRAP